MLRVHSLRVNSLSNPLGIDSPIPTFGWKMTSHRRGVIQKRYQIQVASDLEFQSLTWDSGEVASRESAHVPYNGAPFASRKRYHLRVRIWDDDEASGWSSPAWFETAFLSADEWKADFISADGALPAEPIHHLRTTFSTKKKVVSARAYASAHGLYEFSINGRRVGDAVLTPGWTSYHHQLQYQTYDVTEFITEGTQAIGATLANGWYKGALGWQDGRNHYGSDRAFILQLHLVYEDGSEDVVTTNDHWKAGTGPIRMSEIYHGETYDARLELPGWSTPFFDDEDWPNVRLLDAPKDVLIAQINQPTRVTMELSPKAVFTTPTGERVIDMGQNMVGYVRFRLAAPAGTTVKLCHFEVLDKSGNVYTDNLRSARQTVTYIARGGGMEEYQPHFTFQGFRYVAVDGFPGEISLSDFVGCVVHTDFDVTGSFECSNPLVNQLQQNIVWGLRGNFVDVPTDCPQRDERLGWTGDAQVFLKTALFNADVELFFKKWLRDLRSDQFPDGGVPAIIPQIPTIGRDSSAAWGDAAAICPWDLYLACGDVEVLRAQYRSMRAWVEYVRAQGDDERLWNTGFHYGDWLALDAAQGSYVGATPRDLIATAFYAHAAELVAKAAKVLGYEEDAVFYARLHEAVAARFRDEFITPSGRIVSQTQTAHVLPLIFHLVDDKGANPSQPQDADTNPERSVRSRLAKSLADLVAKNGDKLTTGFVGTPYLCHVLSDNGYHELAAKLVTQTEYPSWLYSVEQGATTIWEHWDGVKPDGEFWSADMNSFNHYAYGSIGDWLYRKLAGLDWYARDEEVHAGSAVWKIAPLPDSSFTFAKARTESVYGTVASGWETDAKSGRLSVHARIPENTTAWVILPKSGPTSVTEGGRKVFAEGDTTLVTEAIDGILQVEMTDDCFRLHVGSGDYAFEVRSSGLFQMPES